MALAGQGQVWYKRPGSAGERAHFTRARIPPGGSPFGDRENWRKMRRAAE